MTAEDRKPIGDEKDEAVPKRPYSKPRLTCHGSVEQITAAAGVTGADGVLGSSLV